MIYHFKVDNSGNPTEKCLSKHSPEDGVMIGSFLCKFDCIKQGESTGKYYEIDCSDIHNASLCENRKSKLKTLYEI